MGAAQPDPAVPVRAQRQFAELLKIQERMLRVRDTMEIEDADGHSVATVKKAMFTPLRERWTVDVANGPDLRVQGNIVDHEYAIEDGGTAVAEVSKKWFRVADEADYWEGEAD